MLNIVMPIAGRGSRFVQAGYQLPKPLIPVHGVPMIEAVVNNVRPKREHRFIFVALKEHLEHLGMYQTLNRVAPGCVIVSVEQVTEGAASTVLLAKDEIHNDNPLMLVNSDQLVDCNIERYLDQQDQDYADGLIMTMWADDPKWSFVKLNKASQVTCIKEKEVISNHATVGIYNFRAGNLFVEAAERMIRRNIRTNGEFYVAPVYGEMIAAGKRIIVHSVGQVNDGMYGIGTPSDLDHFLSLPSSRKLVFTR